MNLYIWGDSGNISYGTDSLVVMAPNLREAKKAAAKAADWSFGREHDGQKPQTDLGKPDKVIRGRAYAAYFMTCE